jgi:hypothetical protein
MNQMLGGQARGAFAAGAEVVQRLEGLAASDPYAPQRTLQAWYSTATDTSYIPATRFSRRALS